MSRYWLLLFLLCASVRAESDMDCLASVLQFESASNEPLVSRVGIAQVILNRVASQWYPNTVCGVVAVGKGKSGCHFSWLCDGRENFSSDTVGAAISRSIAKRMLSDSPVFIPSLEHATLFYSGEKPPWWALSPRVHCSTRLGSFTFCSESR